MTAPNITNIQLRSSTSTVTLDTVAPTIYALPKLLSASGRVNGVLVAGSVVTAGVDFSEQVHIQGVPWLRMDVGGTLVNATFSSSSNSYGKTTALFVYTVVGGLRDADGISILQNGLTLNGASIKDTAGNNATLTHALVADNADYKVDATAATVSSIAISGATGTQNDTLNAGDVVTATVAFNKTVQVTGTPQLGLNIGGTVVQANYAAGKGTANLTFTYTILAGQTDANGISVAANALALNAGTIKDTAGNNATLTHALVADNAAYKVDTTAPATLILTIASDTGSSSTDNISSSGVMNIGALEASATWQYSTNSGTSWNAGKGTIFTLSAGTYAANAVQVRQTDAAGNTGAATLYASAIIIDATAATVRSVAITAAPGVQSSLLNAGDVVTATVAFNETVHVTGTPQLGLNIGGSKVKGNYAAGTGTANLTFTYTILAGQTDANGISFALNSLVLNAGSIKDTAGNNAKLTHALVADNAAYKVDTTAPTFTSLPTASTPENVLTTSAVYTAKATDATSTVSYSLNGTDASKFSINSGTGEVKFITSPDFEAPTDIGLNNVYDINVVATDLAGNASTTAVAITVTNVSEYVSPAGDSVIDLGSYGKLILPVQVEGKWYYYWDLSGSGTVDDGTKVSDGGSLNGGIDRTNGWFLDHTFKYASDFTTVDPYVDIQHPESTNHTYRYATLNGVKLALPTYGGAVDANDRLASAGYLAPTAVSSGTVNNSTYNDLAAIWDAFNGSGTTDNTDGLPTGWADNAYYLSATELNGRGTHAAVGLGTAGYVTSFAEYTENLTIGPDSKMWVALQVL